MKTLIIVGILISTPQILWAQDGENVIEGCEGEGCGCTTAKRTNKSFFLYEKMDSSSKVLGKFKAGTAAKSGKAYSKVLSKGKAQVMEVKDSSLGLKVGDEVTMVFYLGEGFIKFKFGEKWIEAEQDKIQLKTIEPSKFEPWLAVEVGQLKGYTPDFPFFNCLE